MLTDRRARPDAGFTLIELLVVIVIIGIISSMAVIGVGRESPMTQVQREMERMVRLVTLAREEALFGGRELGLWIDTSGYRFAEFDGEAWSELPSEGPWRSRELEGFVIRLGLEGKAPLELQPPREETDAAPAEPTVFLLSSGEVTVFELHLGPVDDEEERYFRLAMDASGEPTLEGPLEPL